MQQLNSIRIPRNRISWPFHYWPHLKWLWFNNWILVYVKIHFDSLRFEKSSSWKWLWSNIERKRNAPKTIVYCVDVMTVSAKRSKYTTIIMDFDGITHNRCMFNLGTTIIFFSVTNQNMVHSMLNVHNIDTPRNIELEYPPFYTTHLSINSH